MNREGKKCVLYPRVSTEMRVDGYSLEGQKNGLNDLQTEKKWRLSAFMRMQEKVGKIYWSPCVENAF